MDLHNEVSPLLEISPHLIRQPPRRVADRPTAECSARQKTRTAEVAVSRLRRRGIELPRLPFVIKEQHRVMHDALVARMKLDRRNELVFGDLDRDDEVLQQVRPDRVTQLNLFHDWHSDDRRFNLTSDSTNLKAVRCHRNLSLSARTTPVAFQIEIRLPREIPN